MSPIRAYSGPRETGELEVEVRVFPRAMLRPQEGFITVYIHGAEDKLPSCSGYRLDYEPGFSSQRFTCESPARVLNIPYIWRTYGQHKVSFVLFDLDKSKIASFGYAVLQIGAE